MAVVATRARISASTAAFVGTSASSTTSVSVAVIAGVTIAASIAVSASTTSIAVSAPVFSISVPASATTAASAITISASAALAYELGGDAAGVLSGPEDLKCGFLNTLGFRRQNMGDEDSIDGEVGVDAHNIADRGTLVEKRAIEDALWLLGSGLSPCVGTIITFAC